MSCVARVCGLCVLKHIGDQHLLNCLESGFLSLFCGSSEAHLVFVDFLDSVPPVAPDWCGPSATRELLVTPGCPLLPPAYSDVSVLNRSASILFSYLLSEVFTICLLDILVSHPIRQSRAVFLISALQFFHTSKLDLDWLTYTCPLVPSKEKPASCGH